MSNYFQKYSKYKIKYLELKKDYYGSGYLDFMKISSTPDVKIEKEQLLLRKLTDKSTEKNVFLDLYQELDDESKKDKQFMEQVIELNFPILYIDSNVFDDIETYLTLIRQAIQKMTVVEDNMSDILYLLRRHHILFQYLNDNFKDNELFILNAIVINSGFFQYISDRLKDDKKFILNALIKNFKIFKHINNTLKDDKDFILNALESNYKIYEELLNYNEKKKFFLYLIYERSDKNKLLLLLLSKENDIDIIIYILKLRFNLYYNLNPTFQNLFNDLKQKIVNSHTTLFKSFKLDQEIVDLFKNLLSENIFSTFFNSSILNIIRQIKNLLIEKKLETNNIDIFNCEDVETFLGLLSEDTKTYLKNINPDLLILLGLFKDDKIKYLFSIYTNINFKELLYYDKLDSDLELMTNRITFELLLLVLKDSNNTVNFLKINPQYLNFLNLKLLNDIEFIYELSKSIPNICLFLNNKNLKDRILELLPLDFLPLDFLPLGFNDRPTKDYMLSYLTDLPPELFQQILEKYSKLLFFVEKYDSYTNDLIKQILSTLEKNVKYIMFINIIKFKDHNRNTLFKLINKYFCLNKSESPRLIETYLQSLNDKTTAINEIEKDPLRYPLLSKKLRENPDILQILYKAYLIFHDEKNDDKKNEILGLFELTSIIFLTGDTIIEKVTNFNELSNNFPYLYKEAKKNIRVLRLVNLKTLAEKLKTQNNTSNIIKIVYLLMEYYNLCDNDTKEIIDNIIISFNQYQRLFIQYPEIYSFVVNIDPRAASYILQSRHLKTKPV